MSNLEVILGVVNGLVAIIAGSAIPFAIHVTARLASLEATLSNGIRSDVTEIRANCIARGPLYYQLSERVARIESHLQNNQSFRASKDGDRT